MDVTKPFECPQCSKSYQSESSLKRHVKTVHEVHERFKCRGCTQTFNRKDYAKAHYKREHVKNAERYNCSFCGKEFKFRRSKNDHEKSHTEYSCPRNSCYLGFDTIEDALEHAKDSQHRSDQQLYECPVENCRLTAIGKVLDKTSLAKHWKMHAQQKHISGELELVYIEAAQPPFRDIPILGSIMANNHSIRLASASLGNTMSEPQEDEDEEEGGDEEGDAEEDEIMVRDDEDINILERNEVWFGMCACYPLNEN
ncbi:hypothetical protein FANTH_11674 [Fusarium anthophilum]|uniref:C2H2-type domain-containing protein n=1 Tax=Fusarium anthophilum TaxID=48485 RepID=A0A8H4YWZ2_9HYPO|nr:hypothetical protein FANTH_11674 [Fusarium anthophilum]